jgi:hypothetical protein
MTRTELSSPLKASRLEAVSSLASSLGISSLVLAALETAEHCQPQSPPQSPPQLMSFPQQLRLPKLPLDDSPVDMRQRRDDQEETAEEEAASPPHTKRPRLTAAAVPMLHSLLSQLPLQPAAQQQQQVMLHSEDNKGSSEAAGGGIKMEEGEEEWGGGGETWEQRLGMSGLGSLLQQHPNHQLASLLTAAAKLKQVAEKAMRKSFSSLNFSALCRLFEVFINGSVGDP